MDRLVANAQGETKEMAGELGAVTERARAAETALATAEAEIESLTERVSILEGDLDRAVEAASDVETLLKASQDKVGCWCF